MREGKLGVVMSDTGYQEFAPNGDRCVVLEHGRRYEVETRNAGIWWIMEFEAPQESGTEDGEAKADRAFAEPDANHGTCVETGN